MLNIRPWTIAFVAVCLAPLGTAAAAPDFYAIDETTDELVRIDAATGQVNVIGSLGRETVTIDLAWLNGTLYGVDTRFDEQQVELLQINPATGDATFLADLFEGATQVTHAEGLASSGGTLKVAFTTAANNASSDRLGDLALNGTITSGAGSGFDADGMGNDAAGVLYGLDSDPATTSNILATLSPTNTIGSFSRTFGAVQDIAFANGDLYGITNDTDSILRINTSNASVISSVALDRAGNYHGLAVVPEPTSLALLGLGWTMLRFRRSQGRKGTRWTRSLVDAGRSS